jgi:DNA-binding LacI/PurR family transcriptional regulator
MRPTLDTIAKKCHVSKVTVSLALRDNPRISAITRRRVHEVARELGYAPNPMVSALMANLRAARKTKFVCNLAFVTAFPTREGWKENVSFLRYWKGITERASELGYGVETHWIGDFDRSGQKISQILENRGIRGLILCPLPSFGMKLGLEWDKFSLVALGHTFNEVPIDHVSNNQFHTITRGLEEARLRGHRRMGLTMPQFVDAKVDHLWLAGLLSWQATHPDFPKITPHISDEFDEASVIAWMKREKPDVVLANHGPVLTWVRTNGWRVPDDLSFLHLNWIPEKGEITGLNQQPEQVGAAAVELLAEQINQNRRGCPENPKTITLESVWNEGTTCPKRK